MSDRLQPDHRRRLQPGEGNHTSAERGDLHYALVGSATTAQHNNTVTLDNARPLLFNTAEAAPTWPATGRGHDQDGKVATFAASDPSVTQCSWMASLMVSRLQQEKPERTMQLAGQGHANSFPSRSTTRRLGKGW